MDDHETAARPDGWPAGRADEDDAMDDVPYAIDVLLHVQRLFCRTQLLLLHIPILQCCHNVGIAKDYR